MKQLRIVIIIIAYLYGAWISADDQVVEKYLNGKVKLKYSVDGNGKKTGRYREYDENGRLLIQASYRDGMLHGPYTRILPGTNSFITASYNMGKLHGKYVMVEQGTPVSTQIWNNGNLIKINGADAYTKTIPEMIETINFIYSVGSVDKPEEGGASRPPEAIRTKTGRIIRKWDVGHLGEDRNTAQDRLAALRRLMTYRYICDVPWGNMVYTEEFNKACTAGARICSAIGKLDHHPPKPAGWSDEDYKEAYRGTSHSNLASSQRGGLTASIDMWMFDSKGGNIAHLGHRMWCLNPRMLKTGIGKHGYFSAIWSMDSSRGGGFNDYIMFPARGYMPIQFITPGHAWSISGSRVHVPGGKFSVNVYPVGADNRRGDPLKIAYQNYSTKSYGGSKCIIFRPQNVEVQAGRKYWVEITFTGAGAKKKGHDIEYLVEFFDLNREKEKLKK